MKRVAPCLAILLCVCFCFGSILDRAETADGYLTTGEYAYGVELEGLEKLTVIGGGADVIDTWDFSRLEVYSTSLPLSLDEDRGVYDIHLHDDSTLLFKGGATQLLVVKRYATAELRGGQINYITSLQYVGWVGRDWVEPFIEIFCRDYDDSNPSRITGTWNVDNDDNGLWDTFNIQLQNQPGYSPVINNIKFTIIPEPASFILLALGGLLLRQNKTDSFTSQRACPA